MKRQVLAVFLLPLLAAGQGTESDTVTPWGLLRQSGGFVVKQCPGEEGTLHLDRIHFHSGTLTLRVAGNLTSEITGGNLSTRVTLGEAPKDATRWQRKKRRMAWSWGRAKFGKPEGTEPLCSGRRCPLAAGAQEMEFPLKRLPKLLLAGAYRVQLSVRDQAARPVVCVEGNLTVGHGRRGEVIRALEDDCYNMAWSEGRDGDEQCQNDIVVHGLCDSQEQGYINHINTHCRKACHWCIPGEADGAEGSRLPWLHALGLLAVPLYWQ